MASTASYFNSTLYRKTMARFWPLWSLWGLGWMVGIPLPLLDRFFNELRYSGSAEQARDALRHRIDLTPECLQLGVWCAALFGLLAAMAVFSYLYSSRSSCMMHSLPLRREGLFLTQYLAGLSMLLLPLAAVVLTALAAAACLLPGQLHQAVPPLLLFWVVESGLCLFFYSFAAFCAMFTGHLLALPVFYGVLNVLVFMVHSLVSALMDQFFFGFRAGDAPDWVELATPLITLSQACEWRTGWSNLADGPYESQLGSLESPGTVAAYAAVGLLLSLAALWIYRRRHVESAGDVVSVPLVRPLFKYGVAICSGLFLGVAISAFLGWRSYEGSGFLIGSVLLWTAAGYWAGEMLLKKSFRVFKAWKGCVAAVAAMALLCACFAFDWLGVEDRVPQADQIDRIFLDTGCGYPYDDGRLDGLLIDDPQRFQQILDLHRATIGEKDRTQRYHRSPSMEGGGSVELAGLEFTYMMKDGSTLSRDYWSIPVFSQELEQEGSFTAQLNALICDRELVAQQYGFDSCQKGRLVEVYLDTVYHSDTDSYDTLFLDQASREDLLELWQAVRADFDAGHIGARYLFDDRQRQENTYMADLVFVWEMPKGDGTASTAVVRPSGAASADLTYERYMTITLTPQAANTLACLDELGALDEGWQLTTHASRTG